MEWYYVANDDSSNGPVPESEMKRLWATKQIDDDTPVWNETMTEWLEISKLPAFKAILSPPAPKGPPRG